MIIRPFEFTDHKALTELAMVAFSDEFRASGMSPESLRQQIRWITFGRMLPFKALTSISGIKWQIFVADEDDRIVGCAAYMGRGESRELANLMVDPTYRRKGIGEALLTTRINELRSQGIKYVTTSILASNIASLANVKKQKFEPFDSYHLYETSLPYQHSGNQLMKVRPVIPSDKAAMQLIEQETATTNWLHIQKTATDNYISSFSQQMLDRFYGIRRVALAFEQNGETIGYILGGTEKGKDVITIGRPIVIGEKVEFIPAMVSTTLSYFDLKNKTTARISIPASRDKVAEIFDRSNWCKTQSWQRLVKWLN